MPQIDDKKETTVDVFVTEEIDRLQRFATAYNACRGNEPETFPEHMDLLGFMNCYEVWLEQVYNAYDEVPEVSNENKVQNSS